MQRKKNKKDIKKDVNERHIEFYDKTLDMLEFILAECARDIRHAEFEFLDMPKNTAAAIDFLISSIGKIQKGQRLALGLDNEYVKNEEPEINIIEGLAKDKI